MTTQSAVCITGRVPGCHCLVAIMVVSPERPLIDLQKDLYDFVVDGLNVALEDAKVIAEFKHCPHNYKPVYKNLPSTIEFNQANAILETLEVVRTLVGN